MNYNSKSVPSARGRTPAPAPAVSTAAAPGLTHAAATAVVAAIEAEKRRTLAILAEARALGIAAEHVSAAVHAGISPEEFVARYHPVEALARQIVESAKLAGGV